MIINILLLVFCMGLAFLGDEEGGADSDANGTKRQGGRDPSAVRHAPRRDDRDGKDGVDDLWDEREDGDLTRMAAGFVALCDHNFTARCNRAFGILRRTN